MALGKRNPKAGMVGRQLEGQCLESLGGWEDLRVVKQFASMLLSFKNLLRAQCFSGSYEGESVCTNFMDSVPQSGLEYTTCVTNPC